MFNKDGYYINLVNNRERYTGYDGEAAARVWTTIYNENCFSSLFTTPDAFISPFTASPLMQPSLDQADLCLEKRVFYRLISGLHTSISLHICDAYLDRGTGSG